MANDLKDINDMVKKSKILLLDIEGTTTSISFVKDKLVTYLEDNMKKFLYSQWEHQEVKKTVEALRKLAREDKRDGVDEAVYIPGEEASKDEQIEGVLKSVEWQIHFDRMSVPVTELQDLIWKQGYDRSEITGHVYEDVSPALEQWNSFEGQKVYIFSSGSVKAQKMLFGQSLAGNLLPFIEGHFDTTIGPKNFESSYTKIVDKIGCKPDEVLFLTDSYEEAEAARCAGLHAALVSREGNYSLPSKASDNFAVLHSFEQLISNKRKTEPQDELPAKIAKTSNDHDVKTALDVPSTRSKSEDKATEVEKMEMEDKSVGTEEIEEQKKDKKKADASPVPIQMSIEEVSDTNEPIDVPIVDAEPIIEHVEKTEEKQDVEEMETDSIENDESVIVPKEKDDKVDDKKDYKIQDEIDEVEEDKDDKVLVESDDKVENEKDGKVETEQHDKIVVESDDKVVEKDVKVGIEKDDIVEAEKDDKTETVKSTETEQDDKIETEKVEIEKDDKVDIKKDNKDENEKENEPNEPAPVAEETPPSVSITEIEDITMIQNNKGLDEADEIIDDIAPVVEEPSEDMEELQSVGEVLEKECDEILSKVQNVTNLDTIPVKPLLTPIAEETMETENTDSNDIVDRILDTEIELEMKQCENIDSSKTPEAETDVKEEAKTKPIAKKELMAEEVSNKEPTNIPTEKSAEKIEEESNEIKEMETDEIVTEIRKTEPNEESKKEETDIETNNIESDIEAPVEISEEQKLPEGTSDSDAKASVESKDNAVVEEVKSDADTTESQVNGNKTNGESGSVSFNGDASKNEELSSRLSAENGQEEEVNGSNGGSVESENAEEEKKNEAEVSDIKVKTVPTEEPHTDPIDQPTEA